MKSFLHQLENNEAILLMYIADELPPMDRQEVEQMLASDANLRLELESLRSTQNQCLAELAGLDEKTSLPVPDEIAIRQITRLMKKWDVERTLRPRAAPQTAGKQFRWRTYSSIAAILLLSGGFAWWVNETAITPPAHIGFGDSSNPSDDGTGLKPPAVAAVPQPKHELTSDEKLALLRETIDDSARNDLSDTESQVVALSRSDDGLTGDNSN